MRLLFLSDRPPSGAKMADAYQTRLEGLSHGLQAHGVETEFLSLRTLRIKGPHLLFSLNAPAIAKHAKNFDVIHAAGAGSATAAIVARLFNKHHAVFDVHGDELMETRLEWDKKHSVRTAYLVFQSAVLTQVARRMANTLLMVSGPFQERYAKRGVPESKMIIVRNGVDTTLFKPSPPHNDGTVRICYAGSFQAWQAADVLQEALTQNIRDGVHFHLIGFAEGDQDLKAQFAAKLGDHATLENRMPVDQLPDKLAPMDVLVISRTRHPVMQGGLPSKFAEYLAMGKPLVVTNVDETSKFVREAECGLVCEPTVESMSAAIRTASQWSAEERQRMGENARRLAETTFDWKVIAKNYLDGLQPRLNKGGRT